MSGIKARVLGRFAATGWLTDEFTRREDELVHVALVWLRMTSPHPLGLRVRHPAGIIGFDG